MRIDGCQVLAFRMRRAVVPMSWVGTSSMSSAWSRHGTFWFCTVTYASEFRWPDMHQSTSRPARPPALTSDVTQSASESAFPCFLFPSIEAHGGVHTALGAPVM